MVDKNFQNFQDFELWQKAANLAEDIFGLSRNIPDAALRTQLTSVAVLVPFRIGESVGRDSADEMNRCLVQAKEPLDDLRGLLNECREMGLLKGAEFAEYDEKCGWLQGAIHESMVSQAETDSSEEENPTMQGEFI